MTLTSEWMERCFPTVVEVGELRDRSAVAIARMLTESAYPGATLIACRAGNHLYHDGNLLVVDLAIELGQRAPIKDIRSVEPVVIVCVKGHLPSICPLRPDFPEDLPHLNLPPRGTPHSLCLFAMPADEAIRVSTPYVLLERTRYWMTESAHGRLHGDDQPLDPVFAYVGDPIVLPPLETIEGMADFYGSRTSDYAGHPIFLDPPANIPPAYQKDPLSVVVLTTKPLVHARLRELPKTAAELLTGFEALGVDLKSPLRKIFREWRAGANYETRFTAQCVVIVRTPIERSVGIVGAITAKAFITDGSGEDFAVALGALYKAGGQVAVPLVADPAVDMAALEAIRLGPMDVHQSFDRGMAQLASGISPHESSDRRITLVGAGALGSQLALTSARMGLGRWTPVDGDHLLPHNFARHGLSIVHVGQAKAVALATEIKMLLGDDSAWPVVTVLGEGKENFHALQSAEIVIDTSASVPTARWLAARSGCLCPITSVFLNPTGRDLVLLSEGGQRTPRLDHVEMSYYWMLVTDPLLHGHLDAGGVGIFPSGGCRQPSMQLSQADIGPLASIAAGRVVRDPIPAEGRIEIWRSSDEGISVRRTIPAAFREVEIDGWLVAVSEQVIKGVVDARNAAGRLETGGILIGTWDRGQQRAYIVGHCPPPPDSVSNSTSFERGEIDVYQTLAAVEASTANNLTYVGEWHSHPTGYSSQPSADDKHLLKWIDDVLAFSDVPPLMLIAGEDGVRVLLGLSGGGKVL